MRSILNEVNVSAPALKAIENFHADCVAEVAKAVNSNACVVVGMKQNPVVAKARKVLDENGIAFTYIEHGGYFSKCAFKKFAEVSSFKLVMKIDDVVIPCKLRRLVSASMGAVWPPSMTER